MEADKCLGASLTSECLGEQPLGEKGTINRENSKNKWKKAQCMHDIKVLEGVILAQDRAFVA